MIQTNELLLPAETMGVDEHVSKAIAAIAKSKSHGVVVVDGKNFFGVVDDRCLANFAGDAQQAKLGAVAEKTQVASLTTTPEELVAMFLETHSRIIPVAGNGRVVGVIARPSIMRIVAQAPLVKGRKAGEFASKRPFVGEDATIFDARSKMRELGCHHLAVVSSSGSLEGLVSSFDVCTKVIPHLRDKPRNANKGVESVLAQKVSAIYKPVAFSCRFDEPLADACMRMADSNVSALVVVDGENKPVGLLTVRDALHAVLKPAAEKAFVYGLREDEKAFKESLTQMASDFLEKTSRKAESDFVALHVKSVQEGAKRRFNVKGKVLVNGKLFSASTPERDGHRANWDLRLCAKEVLDELGRIVSDKTHGKPRALKKHEKDLEEE